MLVAAANDGEEAAFVALYERHRDWVVRLAHRFTGNADDAQDVLPSQVAGVSQPIHALCIVAMGMPIFDNLDLELIGREAEKRKRWDFLVTAAPAAVPGATGSVLNPIATF